jgi:hypothetical protein
MNAGLRRENRPVINGIAVLCFGEVHTADAKEVLESATEQTAPGHFRGTTVQGLRTREPSVMIWPGRSRRSKIAAEANSATSVGLHEEMEGTPRTPHHDRARRDRLSGCSQGSAPCIPHAEAQRIGGNRYA